MKSKHNHKRIVIQDGQDLTIKIYGDITTEERFSYKDIYEILYYRHLLKDEFPRLIKNYWEEFNDWQEGRRFNEEA